jgi:hypothetical protein
VDVSDLCLDVRDLYSDVGNVTDVHMNYLFRKRTIFEWS